MFDKKYIKSTIYSISYIRIYFISKQNWYFNGNIPNRINIDSKNEIEDQIYLPESDRFVKSAAIPSTSYQHRQQPQPAEASHAGPTHRRDGGLLVRSSPAPAP